MVVVVADDEEKEQQQQEQRDLAALTFHTMELSSAACFTRCTKRYTIARKRPRYRTCSRGVKGVRGRGSNIGRPLTTCSREVK